MVQTGRWLLLSANTQESWNCAEAPLCNRSQLESLSIQISWIHFVGAPQMLQSYILKSKSTSAMPTSPLLCVKSTILNRQKKTNYPLHHHHRRPDFRGTSFQQQFTQSSSRILAFGSAPLSTLSCELWGNTVGGACRGISWYLSYFGLLHFVYESTM